ncbi:translocation/assembly module TamB domain-containing protein [Acidovorax lacteus]|uniref:Translocation and assembly module TamB C-terminal domain-containing protein n=1 Tax=Acidovorax lacteus TaxID=1924988 RepID=A0ABP8L743_9BURK
MVTDTAPRPAPPPPAGFEAGASAPPPAHRPRRWPPLLRWLLWPTTALALAVVALWFWAGSAASLPQALALVQRLLPTGQHLEFEGTQGSLRDGGQLARLQWTQPELRVQVQGLRWAWDLQALLGGTLRLTDLSADALTVERSPAPAPKRPRTPPAQATLPLAIDTPLQLGRLQWGPTPAQTLQHLEAHYRYQDATHALELRRLDWADGRYQGRLTLGATGALPLALELQAQVQTPASALGTATPLALALQAQAHGTLGSADAALAVTAQLDTAAPPGSGNAASSPLSSARLQATLRPWAAQPLQQAQASVQALDLALLWPTAPRTALSGEAALRPLPDQPLTGWALQADLANAAPGRWNDARLPLAQLKAEGRLLQAETGAAVELESSEALLGPGGRDGRIRLHGRWQAAPALVQGEATLTGVSLAAVQQGWDAAPLAGHVTARQGADGIVRFAADLRAAAAATGGLRSVQALALQGQWNGARDGGTLVLERLRLAALQARLEADALTLSRTPLRAAGEARASLPGATLAWSGQWSAAQGRGQAQLRWSDAAAAQAWLAQWPGMAERLAAGRASGQGEAQAQWQGGWQSALDAWAALQQGRPPAASAPGMPWQLRLRSDRGGWQPAGGTAATQWSGLDVQAQGDLRQLQLRAQGDVQSGPHRVAARTEGQARWSGAGQLQTTVDRLEARWNKGRHTPWTARLDAPVQATVRWPLPDSRTPWQLEAAAGALQVQGPAAGPLRLRWSPTRLAGGSATPLAVQTEGELQGLTLAWIDALQQRALPAPTPLAQHGLRGDLELAARWSLNAQDDRLRLQAELTRRSGDLEVPAADTSTPTTVRSSGPQARDAGGERKPALRSTEPAPAASRAGLREARLSVDVAPGGRVDARLRWDSERVGQADVQLQTQLAVAPVWTTFAWADDAPLSGQVRARLPDLGVWSALAPPGWRVRGTLGADVALSGTRQTPRWSGSLQADGLRVRSVLEGIDLQDGRLRATLQGDALEITELRLRGASGGGARILGPSGNRTAPPADGGLLEATGRVRWSQGAANAAGQALSLQLQAQATALQVLARADRQLSVSGPLTLQIDDGQVRVRGNLRAQRAAIVLPEESAPRLGDDVVVHSRRHSAPNSPPETATEGPAAAVRSARPADIQLTVDLGDDFALQGLGITTRLRGSVELRGPATADTPPRVLGEIRTEQGRYRAWGQVLDVESGLIRFNGPYQNPSLDILALRPQLAVRAGVQVTGSAQSPRVRLYSDPELPDAEKLAWVVLGRSAAGGGAEAALLQQAALAFLGRQGNQTAANVASRLGLDEIGFKGPGSGDDASSAALTFGKRLARNLYVSYERSLSGTLGTLYIFYDLSRRLTLRGQTGEKSAVDLIYTVQYD